MEWIVSITFMLNDDHLTVIVSAMVLRGWVQGTLVSPSYAATADGKSISDLILKLQCLSLNLACNLTLPQSYRNITVLEESEKISKKSDSSNLCTVSVAFSKTPHHLSACAFSLVRFQGSSFAKGGRLFVRLTYFKWSTVTGRKMLDECLESCRVAYEIWVFS